MKKTLLSLLTVTALFWTGDATALKPVTLPAVIEDETTFTDTEGMSRIDLVICLDTSSSMDSLIDSAKLKLWDIVNTVAKADPKPDLRVALYSYGNNGYDEESGWVRQDMEFTRELDAVYEKLFQLQTNGGKEYVARVTRAAMQLDWRPTQDKTLKMIFVAGNEPADQDTRFPLRETLASAYKNGVYVNTILCDQPDSHVANSWRAAASYGGGRYASINPNKTVVYTSPYDDDLARLSMELNDTYVAYGAPESRKRMVQRQSAQDSNAYSSSKSVAAERAVSKSQASVYNNASWDLVDGLKNGSVNLDELDEAQLPDEFAGKSEEEMKAVIKEKEAQRDAIQKQIKELNEKRTVYIEQEKKKAGSGTLDTFDHALRETIIQQGMENGIKFSK